jgi:hypothetical protein
MEVIGGDFFFFINNPRVGEFFSFLFFPLGPWLKIPTLPAALKSMYRVQSTPK